MHERDPSCETETVSAFQIADMKDTCGANAVVVRALDRVAVESFEIEPVGARARHPGGSIRQAGHSAEAA